jgi:glutamyl-tRNA synthetase
VPFDLSSADRKPPSFATEALNMVRTRFAPSPTGYLHIGGVRTALFNWLFARKHGGQFILRIDDTDQQRNVAEALVPILHGFRWLGLDWDEGADIGGPHEPYYQSQKLERYQEAVRDLVAKEQAYWDYATEDEVKAERSAAESEKRSFLYSRRWMAESEADRKRLESEGRRGVVRLKMPREGNCEFHDHIRGDMVVEWAREQDHVIQRADGSVLYNLANVIDDYDMQITHVIRAEEHLSNTARQIFIARGLGYELPQYAHVPFVAEPGSKNKLSKRKIANYLKNPDFKRIYEHGKTIADRLGLATAAETFNPVIVDFYERVGYLSDAVLNYLVLLGWSLDDKTEDFTRQQMIELFSLERVNKAPASLDVKKLFAFQERYFQALSIGERVERVVPFLRTAGLVSEPMADATHEMVIRIVTEAGPRLVVAGDILEYAHFFQPDDQLAYDDKAFEKLVQKPPGPAQLAKLRTMVAADEPLTAASLKQKVEDFSRAENVKPGPLSQTLRVAVTGKEIGFGTYETVAILGQQRALARIDRALSRIKSES